MDATKAKLIELQYSLEAIFAEAYKSAAHYKMCLELHSIDGDIAGMVESLLRARHGGQYKLVDIAAENHPQLATFASDCQQLTDIAIKNVISVMFPSEDGKVSMRVVDGVEPPQS